MFLLQSPVAAQVKQIRRVVILNDLGVISSPGYAEIDREIFAGLQKSTYQIELYQESLEVTLFADEVSQRRFREEFMQKYSHRKPDVIIAVGSESLKFITESQEQFLSDTPVIFCAIIGKIPGKLRPDRYFTGVVGRLHPEETLTTALHMFPDTRRVVVIGGMGTFDEPFEDSAKAGFQNYQSKLEFTYLTNLTMPALLERLKHLPSNTIVYHTAITKDAAGQDFIDSAQSVPLVASAANAPIFVMDSVDLRGGVVGGDLVNWSDDARVAAGMAVRVLNGEKTQDIPIVTSSDAYMFDWRALQRWRIRESDLPPGSIVLNRPQSFWQLYKRYALAAILVISAQSLAIFALLWQRARRRKIEAELRDSEARLEGIVESAMDAIIVINEEQRIAVFNDAAEKMFGCSAQDALGAPIDRFIPKRFRAEHREHILPFGDGKATTRTMASKDALCGLREDGQEFPIEASISQTLTRGRKLFTVIIRDITERKRAEEALSSVSRRLIEAQEEERTRIARELHDDINQRLAMLAVNLQTLQDNHEAPQGEGSRLVDEACERVSGLVSDVHGLSHRLHSSKLEYLGLEAAAGGFCKEISDQQNVRVDFHADRVPKTLPKEVSLCLFRILQEALQNAIKHSGVRQFGVSLKGASNEIQLTVHDSGIGFDPERASSDHGLGLTSMRERLKLVDGQLSIDSELQRGTTIQARVPLTFKMKAGMTR